ncbi:hypothetical protein, partial [Streptococcus pneumoniae]|uniref:hypothetical protein n=1 Tax=Streptococcus pneumoniae TaxID=1313 RepID=UPI001952C110
DFDVATNARPEQIQNIFQRQCRLVGRRFRLAHIILVEILLKSPLSVPITVMLAMKIKRNRAMKACYCAIM